MQSNQMDYLTIALPKGKLFGLSADLLAKIGYSAEGLSDKSRKLVITNEAKKIKFCYTTEYKNAKIVLIEAIKNYLEQTLTCEVIVDELNLTNLKISTMKDIVDSNNDLIENMLYQRLYMKGDN